MIKMHFEGGDKLAATLLQLSTRASKDVQRQALRSTVAEPIQQAASAKAPRAPGAPDIANNIVIASGRGKGADVSLVVGPSRAKRSDQPKTSFSKQGVLLEFGTSRMQMQPFMRPAFDQVAPRSLGAFAGAMWRALIGRGFGSTRASGGGGGLL